MLHFSPAARLPQRSTPSLDDDALMHPAAIAADDLLQACTETRTKRSGPGGQHRNKVETAVILHHDQTGVSAEASERLFSR